MRKMHGQTTPKSMKCNCVLGYTQTQELGSEETGKSELAAKFISEPTAFTAESEFNTCYCTNTKYLGRVNKLGSMSGTRAISTTSRRELS